MRKLIAAINMTLDGICDHTVMIADDEFHQHYSELLRSSDTILYGRITYQLMEYWPTVVKNPTGNKAIDEFAVVMDNTTKVVFSRTLKNLEWKSARLAKRDIKEEVLALKEEAGKDILVGSPTLIIACLNLHLVDELQLCVLPIIEGKGLQLLKNINERIDLKLLKTKMLKSTGSIVFYYEPIKK
jgi:dihydrofolate reductase